MFQNTVYDEDQFSYIMYIHKNAVEHVYMFTGHTNSNIIHNTQ